jgi:hypothetical protein
VGTHTCTWNAWLPHMHMDVCVYFVCTCMWPIHPTPLYHYLIYIDLTPPSSRKIHLSAYSDDYIYILSSFTS